MPYAGYVGADSFSYAWSDELSPGNIATVQIEVYNNLPYAYGDTFYVQVGEVLIGQLDGYDPDGDSITATLVSGPSHGILELHPDGSFLYTPEQNYLGVDRFSYGWSDGVSESASVHVNLVVHDGESPVAFEVGVSVRHSRPVYSTLQGYDPNGDVLTATLEEGPAHGTVVLVNPHDGTFIYTPTEGYVGPDSFTYEWSDGTNTSNVARVTLSVYNNAPVAQGEFFMLQPGQTFAVFLGDSIPDGYEGAAITVAALLDNDWDPNGDALELVRTGELSERWRFDSSWNAWVFTPPSDFAGIDQSFEYFVTDRVPLASSSPVYNDTYNDDDTYPYSASWRVCMLLQVGEGGGGGGGDGGDQQPPKLSVTVKNVFRPQTIFHRMTDKRGQRHERFSFWWGVALYLDLEEQDRLANLGNNSAFVVTHRTWAAQIGGERMMDNSWHLEIVAFEKVEKINQLKANDNYAGPPGGARTMEDVDETKITALNYISVVNSEGFIGRTKGENSMIVTVEWWVYAGSPGEGILRQFGSDIVRKYRELAQVYMIGRDHYVHNWWTNQRPQINVQPVASGRLSGAIVWNWDKDFDHWFGSPNTDLIRGPQRDGRGPWLPNEEDRISVKWWEYDKAAKKWVNVYR